MKVGQTQSGDGASTQVTSSGWDNLEKLALAALDQNNLEVADVSPNCLLGLAFLHTS